MITRSEKQFIGFMLLITAFNGWSWNVVEAPLALLSHLNDMAYMGEREWLLGPYPLGQIRHMVNQLIILSEIGAVLVIGICFFWLAYQSIYFPSSSPMENVNQRIRK